MWLSRRMQMLALFQVGTRLKCRWLRVAFGNAPDFSLMNPIMAAPSCLQWVRNVLDCNPTRTSTQVHYAPYYTSPCCMSIFATSSSAWQPASCVLGQLLRRFHQLAHYLRISRSSGLPPRFRKKKQSWIAAACFSNPWPLTAGSSARSTKVFDTSPIPALAPRASEQCSSTTRLKWNRPPCSASLYLAFFWTSRGLCPWKQMCV